jgi:hypothetical protein
MCILKLGDVPVGSETPVVTSPILRICRVFEDVPRGRVYVHIFIGMSVRALWVSPVDCVIRKKEISDNYMYGGSRLTSRRRWRQCKAFKLAGYTSEQLNSSLYPPARWFRHMIYLPPGHQRFISTQLGCSEAISDISLASCCTSSQIGGLRSEKAS